MSGSPLHSRERGVNDKASSFPKPSISLDFIAPKDDPELEQWRWMNKEKPSGYYHAFTLAIHNAFGDYQGRPKDEALKERLYLLVYSFCNNPCFKCVMPSTMVLRSAVFLPPVRAAAFLWRIEQTMLTEMETNQREFERDVNAYRDRYQELQNGTLRFRVVIILKN